MKQMGNHEGKPVQREAEHPLTENVSGGDKDGGQQRRLGISDQTFYRWKAKFGDLEVSDVRRLKHLGIENA